VATNVTDRNRLRDAPLWVHALAWGTFALITVAWIAFYFAYRDANVWLHWLGSDGARQWPAGNETHFAERIYANSVFRTSANTWSNLGYVLVGVYILAYALYDARRATTARDPYAVREPALMAYLGVISLTLGFGSAYMHASLTSAGHWWDIFGMYGSVIAIVTLLWGRLVPSLRLGALRLPTWPLWIVLALLATFAATEADGPFSGIQIMTTLIGAIVTSSCIDLALRRTSIQHRWHVLAALSFAIGFGIWNLTNANRFTSPDAWVQGHAVWHVLSALPLGFMAILYRSEKPL
jgi:Ceramidase